MNKVQILIAVTFSALCMPISAQLWVHAQPKDTDNFHSLRTRAHAWFASDDIKERRIQMRQMTRALRQPCKYCHTSGFKGYTDKHMVSLEMMALSAEHSIRCDNCHAGKKTLTEVGDQARQMLDLSKEMGVECTHCHVPASQFKSLNQNGLDYQQTTRTQEPRRPILPSGRGKSLNSKSEEP